MKKNLFLLGAIALAGLFASCSKENIVAEETQFEEVAMVEEDFNYAPATVNYEDFNAGLQTIKNAVVLADPAFAGWTDDFTIDDRYFEVGDDADFAKLYIDWFQLWWSIDSTHIFTARDGYYWATFTNGDEQVIAVVSDEMDFSVTKLPLNRFEKTLSVVLFVDDADTDHYIDRAYVFTLNIDKSLEKRDLLEPCNYARYISFWEAPDSGLTFEGDVYAVLGEMQEVFLHKRERSEGAFIDDIHTFNYDYETYDGTTWTQLYKAFDPAEDTAYFYTKTFGYNIQTGWIDKEKWELEIKSDNARTAQAVFAKAAKYMLFGNYKPAVDVIAGQWDDAADKKFTIWGPRWRRSHHNGIVKKSDARYPFEADIILDVYQSTLYNDNSLIYKPEVCLDFQKFIIPVSKFLDLETETDWNGFFQALSGITE